MIPWIWREKRCWLAALITSTFVVTALFFRSQSTIDSIYFQDENVNTSIATSSDGVLIFEPAGKSVPYMARPFHFERRPGHFDFSEAGHPLIFLPVSVTLSDHEGDTRFMTVAECFPGTACIRAGDVGRDGVKQVDHVTYFAPIAFLAAPLWVIVAILFHAVLQVIGRIRRRRVFLARGFPVEPR